MAAKVRTPGRNPFLIIFRLMNRPAWDAHFATRQAQSSMDRRARAAHDSTLAVAGFGAPMPLRSSCRLDDQPLLREIRPIYPFISLMRRCRIGWLALTLAQFSTDKVNDLQQGRPLFGTRESNWRTRFSVVPCGDGARSGSTVDRSLTTLVDGAVRLTARPAGCGTTAVCLAPADSLSARRGTDSVTTSRVGDRKASCMAYSLAFGVA